MLTGLLFAVEWSLGLVCAVFDVEMDMAASLGTAVVSALQVIVLWHSWSESQKLIPPLLQPSLVSIAQRPLWYFTKLVPFLPNNSKQSPKSALN